MIQFVDALVETYATLTTDGDLSFVILGIVGHLNQEAIAQYKAAERTLMTFRLASAIFRMKDLMEVMTKDSILKQILNTPCRKIYN